MLFLSKANEFSSQNIPKTEKWKHTVKTTRKPSVPPSVPELAQASAIFVKKMKKTFPKKKSSGIPPASLSVPELAQASAKNAGKNMKCMDFPLKVVFEQFSFWCFFLFAPQTCQLSHPSLSSKFLEIEGRRASLFLFWASLQDERLAWISEVELGRVPNPWSGTF